MNRIYANGDFLIRGKYYLFNNLWGAGTGSGSQYLWESSREGSQIAWGTEWSWTGRKDTVKSFAAAVWGWHFGWKIPGTGLPVRLSALRSLRTAWRFELTHTKPGGMNVAYDMWLSGNPRPGGENPAGEVMVWLYNTGNISPIGSRRGDAILGGTGWEVWEGTHPVSGWTVYSFIRMVNTQAQELDLAEFFQYLLSAGMDGSSYLVGVEAGAEVFTGEGRLETTYYSIDVECG